MANKFWERGFVEFCGIVCVISIERKVGLFNQFGPRKFHRLGPQSSFVLWLTNLMGQFLVGILKRVKVETPRGTLVGVRYILGKVLKCPPLGLLLPLLQKK